MFPNHLGHAQHARTGQQHIGQDAKQHHTAHMLAPQPLAQHKGVLRPDGNNQAQTQGHGLQKSRGDLGKASGQGWHVGSLYRAKVYCDTGNSSRTRTAALASLARATLRRSTDCSIRPSSMLLPTL